MYAEERQQAIASLVITQRPRLGRRTGAGLRRHHRDRPARPGRPGQGRRAAPGARRRRSRCGHCTSSSPASASGRPPAPSTRTPSPRPPPSSFRSAAPACCWTPGRPPARIAALLPTDRELVVVTNSVPIAARLAAMPSVSLQLLGGRVRGLTQAAVGEQALRVLDTLRVDIAFIGTNGISVRHGLSTPDSDEAAVKRAMVAQRELRCGGRGFVQGRPRGLRQLRAASPASTPSSPTPRSATPTARSSPSRASRWSSHDRHRHAQPEHRPHGHPQLAADPRRGTPGQLGDHRARRQGRQRRTRPDTGRVWTPSRCCRRPATIRW